MAKYTGGKSWLAVLILKQDGKIVKGAPTAGAYAVAHKPGQKLYGSAENVIAQLTAAFPGCTFAWEK